MFDFKGSYTGGFYMIKRRLITITIVCALVSVGLINTISTPILDTSTEFSKQYILSESTLNFSTYFGGQHDDIVNDIVIDTHGDIYITGWTDSDTFPTTPDAFDRLKNGPDWTNDVFVMKISNDGQEIIYSTFLGGSGLDEPYGIDVDDLGCVYVVGKTDSVDFPTLNAYDSTFNGGLTDSFVTKLSADGSEIVFSTFIGGASEDCALGLELDSERNCIVVGETHSSNFPIITTNNQSSCHSLGHQIDGFVFKLSHEGNNLEYSMYLGGEQQNDGIYDVAIDSQDNAVIVGWSASGDYPTVNPLDATLNGSADCVISKVNETGDFIFSTYYGGIDIEYASILFIDDSDQLYISGVTKGETFPKVNIDNQIMNGTCGLFLVVLDSMCMEISFSGVVRNSFDSGIANIVAISEQEVWLAGSTDNAEFPTTENAFSREYGTGEGDGYFLMIDPLSCTLNYSSFFGGSRYDYISGFTVNAQGSIICAGGTNSVNLPVMNALQSEKIGDITFEDGFVFRMQIDNRTSTEVPEVLLLTITGVGVVLVVLMVILIVKRRP